MNTPGVVTHNNRKLKDLLMYNRWPWHLGFWIGYVIFRFWLYYITVTYYPQIFLEYMLLSEIMFVCITYFTIWLYKRLFLKRNYAAYFAIGTLCWILYLYLRTRFQFYYLQDERGFKGTSFPDMMINNLTVVIVYFFFITACKYFKDGFISQQYEAERKEEQLRAEVNDLKSQIAPHFLFNTLNNLYGLAVEKSDKLPDLMLRLSHLLRHSLYETQNSLVPLTQELEVLKSYIKLESLRLEDDLRLEFNNEIPEDTAYEIAPLLLIVFVENAFKHAKFVQGHPVNIYIKTTLNDSNFTLRIKNNFNNEKLSSAKGIGLTNVRRRLELLYPGKHELNIIEDETFYTVSLQLQLLKT